MLTSLDRLVVAGSVIVAVVVGAALRGYCLGCRGLWLDEVLLAQTIRFDDIGDALAWIRVWVDHTPLAWLMTWLLRDLGGSETAIRWPYALASVLNIPAMFWLGSLIGGRRAGVVAAALLAVSPFAVFYAQEARVYALLMLFSTLAMGFAFVATRDNRMRHWTALALLVTLSLYTSYLALLTIAAAYTFVALTIGRMAASESSGPASTTVRRAIPAVGSVVVAGVLFSPWLSQAKAFITRDDLSLNRFATGSGSTSPDAVFALLRSLDFSGVMFVLLVAGVAAAAFGLTTARWRESALALCWVVIPVTAYVVRFGPGAVGVWERYWSVSHPALILVSALGIVQIASMAVGALTTVNAHLRRRIPAPTTARLIRASVIVAGLGLAYVQLLPATLATYDRVKGDDYRGGAELIAASGGEPLVMAAGTNADWLIWGLDYYLWLLGGEATVVRAEEVRGDDFSGGRDSIWLAAYPQFNPLVVSDVVVEHPLTGYHLYHTRGPERPVAQALTLLEWSRSFAPAVENSIALLRAVEPGARLGANLIADTAATGEGDGWTFQPGSEPSDASGVVLRASGTETNATFITRAVRSGSTYVVSFTCSVQSGSLRAFATAHDQAGGTLAAFPDGAGYACGSASRPTRDVFAFTAPPGTSSIALWFRATPDGAGTFDDISLRAVVED